MQCRSRHPPYLVADAVKPVVARPVGQVACLHTLPVVVPQLAGTILLTDASVYGFLIGRHAIRSGVAVVRPCLCRDRGGGGICPARTESHRQPVLFRHIKGSVLLHAYQILSRRRSAVFHLLRRASQSIHVTDGNLHVAAFVIADCPVVASHGGNPVAGSERSHIILVLAERDRCRTGALRLHFQRDAQSEYQ